MTKLYESDVEKLAIEMLEKQGYVYLSPEKQEAERQNLSDVVLRARLKAAIDSLNPTIPGNVREQALRQVVALSGQNPIENNEAFYQMLIEGVAEEYQKNGETVGAKVRLMDFHNPPNNNLVVCNQFTVTENNPAFGHGTGITKRPDVVLFINGLPLVVVELKNPTDENATVQKAFAQLQTYKQVIPSLFCYNGILVASDGFDARAGSLTSGWTRFMAWKTVDGKKEDSSTTPQIETLIRGMLRPDVLLDLIRHFTVFEKTKKEDVSSGLITIETVKKVAAYHQYHAVKEAVKSTIRASYGEKIGEDPEAYSLPGGVCQHSCRPSLRSLI